MPRKPKPFYWKARKGWYCTIDGQRYNLGPDKKAAEKQFHHLMAKEHPDVLPNSVVEILDDFLTWTEENRAKRTYERYRDFIQSFCSDCGRMKVSEVTPRDVTSWLSNQKGWNSTTKRNAITALQRGFNWAVKNRGLDRNPIKGMEKPEAKRRTSVITPEEFENLIEAITDRPFKDLMVLSYDSGSRPQELKQLEARHLQLDKARAVIPAEEAKGKIPRAIYFPTDRSIEILKRLSEERPQGPLLLNNRGNAWTGFAVKNRLEDLVDVLGRRITHYTLRHSFVTRKLVAGVDSHVVASLAGHKDVNMIHKVYSHVAEDHKFMLENAKKGQ